MVRVRESEGKGVGRGGRGGAYSDVRVMCMRFCQRFRHLSLALSSLPPALLLPLQACVCGGEGLDGGTV